MFQVCDNENTWDLVVDLQNLSCNCSTLVSLSIKWVQSVLELVEKCSDSGVVCNNLPISFHLQMSQACDFLALGFLVVQVVPLLYPIGF